MTKTRVLFVCLGNICRSPMAEAIFKHQVKIAQLQEQFFADSCGTANYHVGDWPDPRTIKIAHQNGVLVEHTGRQLSRTDFEDFDLILAMDSSNYRNILSIAPNGHQGKVKLMREFDPEGAGDVPDPYYGDERDFQEVFTILDRCMKKLLKTLNGK